MPIPGESAVKGLGLAGQLEGCYQQLIEFEFLVQWVGLTLWHWPGRIVAASIICTETVNRGHSLRGPDRVSDRLLAPSRWNRVLLQAGLSE